MLDLALMLPPCKARVHERRDDYANKPDHAHNERLKLLNDLHHDCRVVAFCCICIDPDNARGLKPARIASGAAVSAARHRVCASSSVSSRNEAHSRAAVFRRWFESM